VQSIMRVDRFDGHGQRVRGEFIRTYVRTAFANRDGFCEIRRVALSLLMKENMYSSQ